MALALALPGCQSPGPDARRDSIPAPDPSRAGELAPEESIRARQLYIIKCAKCHKFYHPANYDAAEWHSWMKKMSKKARLTPDEDQLLSKYLDTFRPPRATR